MSDRRAALEMALKQIEKQFGKGSIMRLGESANVQVETVSSGSLALDIALGVGGFPRGRIIEIYGPESSGKTTVALHVIHISAATRPGKNSYAGFCLKNKKNKKRQINGSYE